MILLFMLLISFAHATTWWVVPDASDSTKNVIVGTSGFAPQGAIARAPIDPGTHKPYPIEGVDIVDVPDCPQGGCDTTHKEAQMDSTKLWAFNDAETKAANAAKAAKDSADSARAARIQALKTACAGQTGAIKAICDHLLNDM